MEVARWAGFTHTNLLVREAAQASAGFHNAEVLQRAAEQENNIVSSLRPAKNTQADGGGTLYWQTMEIGASDIETVE